jgi:hypothetical protein
MKLRLAAQEIALPFLPLAYRNHMDYLAINPLKHGLVTGYGTGHIPLFTAISTPLSAETTFISPKNWSRTITKSAEMNSSKPSATSRSCAGGILTCFESMIFRTKRWLIPPACSLPKTGLNLRDCIVAVGFTGSGFGSNPVEL